MGHLRELALQLWLCDPSASTPPCKTQASNSTLSPLLFRPDNKPVHMSITPDGRYVAAVTTSVLFIFRVSCTSKNHVPVSTFSVEQVQKWVENIPGVNLVHARKLAEQEIDGEQLLKLTEEKLDRCGIPMGPAGKIMDALGIVLNSSGSDSKVAADSSHARSWTPLTAQLIFKKLILFTANHVSVASLSSTTDVNNSNDTVNHSKALACNEYLVCVSTSQGVQLFAFTLCPGEEVLKRTGSDSFSYAVQLLHHEAKKWPVSLSLVTPMCASTCFSFAGPASSLLPAPSLVTIAAYLDGRVATFAHSILASLTTTSPTPAVTPAVAATIWPASTSSRITCLALSAGDGQCSSSLACVCPCLAVASWDGRIALYRWNHVTNTWQVHVPAGGPLSSSLFTSSAASAGVVVANSLAADAPSPSVPNFLGPLFVAWSPNGEYLAIPSASVSSSSSGMCISLTCWRTGRVYAHFSPTFEPSPSPSLSRSPPVLSLTGMQATLQGLVCSASTALVASPTALLSSLQPALLPWPVFARQSLAAYMRRQLFANAFVSVSLRCILTAEDTAQEQNHRRQGWTGDDLRPAADLNDTGALLSPASSDGRVLLQVEWLTCGCSNCSFASSFSTSSALRPCSCSPEASIKKEQTIQFLATPFLNREMFFPQPVALPSPFALPSLPVFAPLITASSPSTATVSYPPSLFPALTFSATATTLSIEVGGQLAYQHERSNNNNKWTMHTL